MANLTREQIRQKLGLASPRFHITVRDGTETGKIVESRTELSSSTEVIFDGVGKGHGVGLSQWGAQGMASMLDSDGTPLYTYVDILKHYYPGAELVDNYNIPKERMEPVLDDSVEPVYQGTTEPVKEDRPEPAHKERTGPVCEAWPEPMCQVLP